MNHKTSIGIGFMEGKTYIVGREGHIYVNDPSVSRQHAEIKFIDGRIRLRDLNSSNGTYVLKANQKVQVQEGYVKPQQPIAIGLRQCTVQSLLANVGVHATYSDAAGLTIELEKPA
jgi:pSer/pThr/pTyr-binding forkhead associated (FHA) protein